MTHPDRYAVIGHPVEHSLSPQIHHLFAEQTGEHIHYEKILAPLDEFEQTVADFITSGGKGFNITTPFKQQAWSLSQQRSDIAELTKSVNTMSIVGENNILSGDSTDGSGLIRDLTQNHQYTVHNKKILLLGAGGAAFAAAGSLLAEKPQLFVVANRTETKAHDLADWFKSAGSIQACSMDPDNAILNQHFDLVINATTASLQNSSLALPASIITSATVCYDMMYGKKEYPFLNWAKEMGAQQCHDGLGMLVEQAADAFYIWRQVRPETNRVITQIRNISS